MFQKKKENNKVCGIMGRLSKMALGEAYYSVQKTLGDFEQLSKKQQFVLDRVQPEAGTILRSISHYFLSRRWNKQSEDCLQLAKI